MLREAAAGPSERPRASLEEVLADPQTARYVEDWGRAGDTGRIAESPEGTALGAAWYRQYSAAQPGYGFVSETVPEVSMAVDEQARGAGVGTALLTALVDEARRQGHPALSLSVLHDNPAVRLYERLGCGSRKRQTSNFTLPQSSEQSPQLPLEVTRVRRS